MKLSFISGFWLLVFVINCYPQVLEKDFRTIAVNKKVKEFSDKFDLSTPLDSYIAFTYLRINGKEGLFRPASSRRIKGFMRKPASYVNPNISDEKKTQLLNTTIKEIIIYKDSIAGVISDYVDSLHLIRFLSLEKNQWLNAGEDLGNNLTDAQQKFKNKSAAFLGFLHKVNQLSNSPGDTASFITYLNQHGREPKEFLLNSFIDHKIVIYGELHRRKKSWDLLKDLIKQPLFAERVGTVFLEISSDKQNELNRFFNEREANPEIVLNIFREIQINGWYDKGMYEFIMEMWKLNKSLPENEKIKVVAVDIPRPFNSLKNIQEYNDHFKNVLDRNEQMANIIEQNIKSGSGIRSNLFIVGLGHAYKCKVAGIASGKSSAKLTAAAQLAERFSNGEVFSIFTHCPVISNDGLVHGKIRNGLFDNTFSKMNNKPIGFNLRNSPFGAEPFDAVYEISYDSKTGKFEDSYDAYIFLESLDREESDYILFELFTDDFIQELKRRVIISNSKIESWYGVKEVSKEAIISKFKGDTEGKKRWEFSE